MIFTILLRINLPDFALLKQ